MELAQTPAHSRGGQRGLPRGQQGTTNEKHVLKTQNAPKLAYFAGIKHNDGQAKQLIAAISKGRGSARFREGMAISS